jgi:hypothetical protein
MKPNQTVFTAKITMAAEEGGKGLPFTVYHLSDTPFNYQGQYYEPAILRKPSHTGRVGLTVWGNQSQSSSSDMEVSAVKYPDLQDDPRIRQATIEFTVYKKNSYGAVQSKDVFVGVLNTVKKKGKINVLNISNYMSELDKAMEVMVFPDTIENSVIHYNPLPIAMGFPRTCPMLTTDENNDHFLGAHTGIEYYQDVSDNGDILTPTVDWLPRWEPLVKALGFETTSSDYGTITADVVGAWGTYNITLDVDYMSGNGDMVDWDGGFGSPPTGWAIFRVSNSYIYESPSDHARFRTDLQTIAGDTYAEFTDADLEVGKMYRLELTYRRMSNETGYMKVMNDDIEVAQFDLTESVDTVVTIDFIAEGTAFKLQCPDYTEVEIDVAIKNVTVKANLTTTRQLLEMCHHAFVVLGGIDPNKVNWTSFDAVNIAKPHRMGFYSDKAVNIKTFVNQINDSLNTWMIDDSDGKISCNYLQDPETLTSVFEITDANRAGKANVDYDWATGLKDTIGVKKNNYVFDYDRIADIVSEARKQLLIKDHRRERKATVTINPFYAHAISAEIQPSLLDKTTDAELEIDQRCGLFTQIRYFTEVPVTMTDFDIYDLNYGDCITFEGQKHILVGKKFTYGDDNVILTLWN